MAVLISKYLTMIVYILFPLLCLLNFRGLSQFIDQYGFYIQRNASDQNVRLVDYSLAWGYLYLGSRYPWYQVYRGRC